MLPELGNPLSPGTAQAESIRPMAVAWYLTKKAKRLAPRGHWHQKEANMSSQRKRGVSHVVLEERDGGDGWKEGGGEALGFLAGTAAC
jgi:hypothetical protein